ncbi:FHA domain-containing protein [Marinobacter mobilis]|uniref:FHA domain-containing protein n=1 Tax=Marinobacter mobilis TaxID=488533 RepID=A0A1H3AVA9_9GAMM|nr:FHA domain-containing protein [Marinobacter mobilis]SDX32769.1 FHA domain-containing protein [Marinobacter mobilis]
MTSFTVGRGEQADVRLNHDTISRLHLRVTLVSPGAYLVEDLGSANGTWLLRDERRFPLTAERLGARDLLLLGDYSIELAQLLDAYQQSAQPARPTPDADSNTRDPFSRYIRSEDGRYVRKPK